MLTIRPPLDDTLDAFCTDTDAYLEEYQMGLCPGLPSPPRTSSTWRAT